MNPDRYRIQLQALWAIPSILSVIDLPTLLDEAQRIGSPSDIELIKTLMAVNLALARHQRDKDL